MTDVPTEKPKRTRAPAKKKKPESKGNKTLAAALVACALAAFDLYMTLRHGLKIF